MTEVLLLLLLMMMMMHASAPYARAVLLIF